MFFAKEMKKKRDAEDRLRQTSPPVQFVSELDSEGAEVQSYKTLGSHTHDERYYTEAEVDAKVSAALAYYEPITNGDVAAPELLFHNGDVLMGVI